MFLTFKKRKYLYMQSKQIKHFFSTRIKNLNILTNHLIKFLSSESYYFNICIKYKYVTYFEK